MKKKDLALKIGTHILDSIDKMKKDKRDFGTFLEIPFKPECITSDELDFIYSLKLGMPRYTRFNFDGTIESITMAEYFQWDKQSPDNKV